jgi:hypothetical protein
MILAMFIFYFCLKQQDKHCTRHYDCDYDSDYDKKNKIQTLFLSPLFDAFSFSAFSGVVFLCFIVLQFLTLVSYADVDKKKKQRDKSFMQQLYL